MMYLMILPASPAKQPCHLPTDVLPIDAVLVFVFVPLDGYCGSLSQITGSSTGRE